MADIANRLKELNITLPESAPPLFNYVPFVVTGNLVFVAGQISSSGGKVIKGRVGDTLSMEEALEAAKLCAINILTQIRDAVGGDWARVKRCVKLGGFVNCGPDFTDQSVVINAASDLIVAVMGEAGKHARFAVGASSLPAGFAVEIDAVFEISA